jgi:hypothetical protein
MLMPWFCALNRKTSRVDTMTDASGAHAEIQKNFGHLMLCIDKRRHSDKQILLQVLE